MRQLVLLPVIFLLSGCGMKGDLYEPTPPGESAAISDPGTEAASADADKGERKTIPSTPAPGSTE